MISIPVNNNWEDILNEATQKESWKYLIQFLNEEYKTERVFPEEKDLWTAFEWTDYEDVKVVILGQDPYHGADQAHGLSFSVQPTVAIPPSLRNIYKELENDLGIPAVEHGYLRKWAEEGVFLLNTVMTVRKGDAGSHRGKGWEDFTDSVICALNERKKPIVFILWGAQAQKKRNLIDEDKHFVLTSSHPSPLAAYRSFYGSKPFSKTNRILTESGQRRIDWKLPPKSLL